jgi:hypothetical protein
MKGKKLKGLPPAKTPHRYFMPCKVCYWKHLKTGDGSTLQDTSPVPSIGCIPVYETREQAEAAFPDVQILEFSEVL